MLHGSIADSDILISMQKEKQNRLMSCNLKRSMLYHEHFYVFLFIAVMPNYQCSAVIFWMFDKSRCYQESFVL